jgi:adenylate cyclase
MSQQLAVLFADLSGSTAVYERMGDAAAKKLVDVCLMRVARCASNHQGLVIKTIGDELMLRFPSADQAAAAAILMQLENIKAQSPFQLRIGFHFGPVILESSDVFGDAVNTAARLSQMARDGQILTSEEALQRFSAKHKAMTRRIDFDKLRGKSQATQIIELMWEPNRELTRAANAGSAALLAVPDNARLLRLSVNNKERAFSAQDAPITVGREDVSSTGATNSCCRTAAPMAASSRPTAARKSSSRANRCRFQGAASSAWAARCWRRLAKSCGMRWSKP